VVGFVVLSTTATGATCGGCCGCSWCCSFGCNWIMCGGGSAWKGGIGNGGLNGGIACGGGRGCSGLNIGCGGGAILNIWAGELKCVKLCCMLWKKFIYIIYV